MRPARAAAAGGAALAAALLLIGTGPAAAYRVTRGAAPVGDAPSRFEPRDFPASRLAERPQPSTAGPPAQASSFGLKNMDSETRSRTEATLTELGARRDGDRILVTLPGDVLFDFDRADIRADARPVLARLAQVLSAMGDAPLDIVGHTDAKGADDYNQDLSERRAKAVSDWLAGLGIAAGRIATSGRGESVPVAPNTRPDGRDDPDGRQRNRRVEFMIRAAD